MGSPETEKGREENETRRRTTLTQGFWLMETSTTQAMWKSASVGRNRSAFAESGERAADVAGTDTSDFPVECVRWSDCLRYAEKLQEFAPKGWKFTLPTEAQWDYLPPLSCASSNCQYC